jgi:hypothetical protein
MKVKSPRIGGFRGRSLIIERTHSYPDSAMPLNEATPFYLVIIIFA